VDYPVGAAVPGPNEWYVHAGSSTFKFTYRVRARDQSPNQNVGLWNAPMTVP